MKKIFINRNKKEKPNINLTVVRCESNIWEDLRILQNTLFNSIIK